MASVVSYLLGPLWPSVKMQQPPEQNGHSNVPPTESTSLMSEKASAADKNYDETDNFHSAREVLPQEELQRLNDDNDEDIEQPLKNKDTKRRPPSVHEFYFSPENPTVQRYYRFTSTPLTPIAALHKRPGPITPRNQPQQQHQQQQGGGVTGLLRRSAVVPSHGTDITGEWILVSVGGRSGWARKKSPEHQYAGFTPVETFQATEGWMGNHAFLFRGKVMLGSDAPSLFFTNGLLILGALMHFGLVLPELANLSAQNNNNEQDWFLISSPPWMFCLSLLLFVLSWVFLWVCAIMDPGILPGECFASIEAMPSCMTFVVMTFSR